MNVGYRFGPFVLDPKERAVSREGTPVPVTRKGFELLLYLAQHPNRIVTKQDLMKAVWPDTFVEEGNLTQNISLLRKALGKPGDAPLIVTVAREGYKFTADVIELDSFAPGVEAVPGPSQRPARIWWRTWRRDLAAAALALAVIAVASIAWRRSRAGSSSGAVVRLAVLPFANLTGDSAQEYLADGLTEELITQLARLRPEQLGVIARTSVMRYKRGDKPVDEIGRDLSVNYALESSLRRSADRLRVTVQLIRIGDQSHIWANDFDYPQEDVFRIEDSVAAAVGREVQLRLTPAQRDRLTRAPPTNWRAVEAVMRGRDHLLSQAATKVGWESAKGYFDQAIGLDSTYALAWAWLSATYRYGPNRGYMPADSGYRAARQTISRALALDPTLPEAWEQLGQLQLFVDWDWAAANKSFQRAVELDPGSVEAIRRLAVMRETLGDMDGAIALNRRALQLDPLDVDAFARLGFIYYNAGQFDEAEKSFEMIPPARRNADYTVVLLDLARGRVSDAATAVVQVADPVWQQFVRVLVLDRQGRRQAADSTLSSFIGQHHTEAAYQIAELYASRREADSAFAWLDRAYAQRDQGLQSIKFDLFFKSLHDDPRYGALLRKMRLPV